MWVAVAVDKQAEWSGPFDVPLRLGSVHSLAAEFITRCLSRNPVLPVKAFPTLTFPAGAAPGKKVTLTFDKGKSTGTLYAVFYTGTSAEYAKIDSSDKSVTIPKDLVGTVYAVASTNGTASADADTVAGVAMLEFAFNSE